MRPYTHLLVAMVHVMALKCHRSTHSRPHSLTRTHSHTHKGTHKLTRGDGARDGVAADRILEQKRQLGSSVRNVSPRQTLGWGGGVPVVAFGRGEGFY